MSNFNGSVGSAPVLVTILHAKEASEILKSYESIVYTTDLSLVMDVFTRKQI